MASGQIVSAMLVGGGVLAYSAWKDRRRARLVQDTPRSKIGSAPQGLVEVEGFAWSSNGKTIKSLDGWDLVYQEFHLQRLETRGSGKSKRKEWVNVFTSRHQECFYLSDPTGLAIIDPQKCDLNIKSAKTVKWEKLSAENKESVIRKVRGSVTSFPPSESFLGKLFAQPYRVVEREIRLGTHLYVTGDFEGITDERMRISEPGLSNFTDQVIDSNSRTLRNKSAILDTNKDGKVSVDEAREGYSNLARLTLAKSNLNAEAEREFEVFGMIRGSDNHTLFIADQSEEALVGNLLRFNKSKFVLGGLLVLGPILSQIGIPTSLWRGSSGGSTASASSSRSDEMIMKQEQVYQQLQAEIQLKHASCVSDQAEACETLLSKSDYDLRPEHVAYYRAQACRLGKTMYCNDREPARAASPDAEK